MELSILLNLYHGTSDSSYFSIKRKGFKCSDKNFNHFLSASGIYFVVNRPLIALRFASKSTEPIVLSASLSEIPSEKILDLTSDKGMNILWKAYDQLNKLNKDVDKWSKDLLNEDYDQIEKDYILDKLSKHNKIIEEVMNPTRAEISELETKNSLQKPNLNIDSIVLNHLSRYYILIISAVNEGVTLQKKFNSFESEYQTIEGYNGIRARNHLEVCVTDTNYILKDSICEINVDRLNIDENFYSHVISER